MKIRIIIIFILFFLGGIFNLALEKEKRKIGNFDYRIIFDGINKNYIDAVDIIFALMNRPRFKADINWINFIQKSGSSDKSSQSKTVEYLTKSIFTDPYFHEAKLYGGLIATFALEKSEVLFRDILNLTKILTPDSHYMRYLTFIYLMNYNKSISDEEIIKMEKEILTVETSILYYKYFIFFYEKRKMSDDVKRLYKLALNKTNQADIDEKFKQKALSELSK